MTTSRITAVVADAHGAMRDATVALLSRAADVEVVGAAGSGQQIVALCRTRRPDVAVLGLSMPFDAHRWTGGGLEAMREIRAASAQTRLLVLTRHDTHQHVWAALDAGASGYLVKQAGGRELLEAVRQLHQGRSVLRVSLADGGLREVVIRPSPSVHPRESMSLREIQVVQLVALGYTNKEIAAKLGVGAKSISTYRARVRDKLGVETRAEIVRFALQTGLLAQSVE